MSLKALIKTGNLSYYCCIICIAILSLYIHWLPPFMLVWVLFWFLEKMYDTDKSGFAFQKSTKLFYLFIALFLWQIIGLFYADSLGAGVERIYKRASFILFPLVLFYPAEKIKVNVKMIMRLFALFILIYLIYCFIVAFYHSVCFKDGKMIFNQYDEYYTYESYFAGYRFSGSVHPSYLSMYVMLALVISLESFFDKQIIVRLRAFWFVSSIVFLFVIYLLSSRAGVLAAGIVVPLFIISKLYKRMQVWLVVFIIALVLTFSAGLLITNSRLKSSFEDISKENFDKTIKTDARLLIWRSAFGVIDKNILFGVGTGDASEELKKEFLKRGYSDGYYDNLNAHNQFLEILIENGLTGLIFFLAIIGYMGFIAISDRNNILLFFLLSMVIFFLFESVLNRLAGITFFPLFSFLLLHYKPKLFSD